MAVAALWPFMDENHFRDLGIEILWASPDQYFSDEWLGSILNELGCELVFGDSIETLERLDRTVGTPKIAAFFLDDFAETSKMRGDSETQAVTIRRLQGRLLREAPVVLLRGNGMELSARNSDGLITHVTYGVSRFRQIDVCQSGPILYLGNFFYPPNRSALRRAAMACEGLRKLRVVGPISSEGASFLRKHGQTDIVGCVDSIEEVADGCCGALDLAQSGSGTSTKILTYAKLGLPVICTPFALRGINDCLGELCRVVESEDQLSKSICSIPDDFELSVVNSIEARNIVMTRYDLDAEASALVNSLTNYFRLDE
ncbi:hypothetical protein [Williamsia muralis]|nr:hypothetical protein [Williamsia marianensis]